MMKHEDSAGRVLVVGSANMDMVVGCDRFPKPGETIFGEAFAMHPGGKGANQAVACAKLGGTVQFIGKMGDDLFRAQLTEHMTNAGVDLAHLLVSRDHPTGMALITVDGSGQNQIIVVSGSNMHLTPADLDTKAEVFQETAVVLLQLEIPMNTVQHAAQKAAAVGATVILNPAPADDLPDELLQHIDFLTPNESEAERLTGLTVTNAASAGQAAQVLLQRGVKNVIVTLGAQGALWARGEEATLFSAPSVRAVDTTAAGDAFNGALACALAASHTVEEALRLANRAGAFAVTREGAQPSMPTQENLEAFFSVDGTPASSARLNQVQL